MKSFLLEFFSIFVFVCAGIFAVIVEIRDLVISSAN